MEIPKCYSQYFAQLTLRNLQRSNRLNVTLKSMRYAILKKGDLQSSNGIKLDSCARRARKNSTDKYVFLVEVYYLDFLISAM